MLPANRPCGSNSAIACRLQFFHQVPGEKEATFSSISRLRDSAHGPVRIFTIRMPGSSAGMVAVSHSRQTVGKKTRARGTLFPQNFISTIAVISNCRRADEYPRLLFRPASAFRQISGADDPAIVDAPLFLARPNSKDAFARKMNHRVKAGNFFRRNRLRRIPGYRRLCAWPSREPGGLSPIPPPQMKRRQPRQSSPEAPLISILRSFMI